MSAFLRFVGAPAALLCSLQLLFAAPPASAAASGEVTRVEASGDWISAQVCFLSGCIWRAATPSSRDDTLWLIVTFRDGRLSQTGINSNDLTMENLRTWDTDSDRVTMDFRIDTNPVTSADIERKLDRDDRSLYADLPEAQFGEGFLGELRRGTTLRVRYRLGDSKPVIRFSLKGAQKAIDRARRLSAPKRTGGRRGSSDDRYFEDSPGTARPRSDGEFFL